jgi:predicted phage-related endonuclease
MTMTYHDFKQGSPDWMEHRARSYNASEASVMLGCSPYATRTELMKVMATGIPEEISQFMQRLFDDGHLFEHLARPLAEKLTGEPLSPVTGSRGKLSASFDGLSFSGKIGFEHKMLSATLAATLPSLTEGHAIPLFSDDIPLHHRYQMEQQMLVSGATRVLFMATRWGDDDELEAAHGCWYESSPELRAHLIPGWKQFERDLAEFAPSMIKERPKAEVTLALPALFIHAKGEITTSNMMEYGTALAARLAEVRAIQFVTEQDFSNAKESAKLLRSSIVKAQVAKDAMLSQTATVGEAARMIDAWCEDMRITALQLEKDAKEEDSAKKVAMVSNTRTAYQGHIESLRASIEWPAFSMPTPDWPAALKNKSKYANMQDALDTMLANAKIAADTESARIHANIKTINVAGNIALFADLRTLVLKQADDLAAIIEVRLAAETARKEADRLKTLADEAARLARENAARAAVELVNENATAPAPPLTINMIQSKADLNDAVRTGVDLFVVTDAQMTRVGPSGFMEPPKAIDDGKRINLTEINARLAPVAITVAGLSDLGFEPAEQVKASRLYRASDLPAICQAISAHVLTVAVARQAFTA